MSYNNRRGYDSQQRRPHDSRRDGGRNSGLYLDQTPSWSWASTIVSVISMTCFASWCGIMGVLYSGLSYTDHKVGDYKRSKYKRWWAWCFAISGIIITVIAIIFLILVMYVFNVQKPTFQGATYWVPRWLYDELDDPPNSTIT